MLPLVAVLAVIVLSRLIFAEAIAAGPQPAIDWRRAYLMVAQGTLAIFTLRGSDETLHRLLTLGTTTDFAIFNPTVKAFVCGWLAVGGVAGILCWLYAPTRGVRLLVLFFVVHLLGLTLAGGMASRQVHLLAVPAALLTIWFFWTAAKRLESAIATPTGTHVCAQLPAAGVLLLVIWALPDHPDVRQAAPGVIEACTQRWSSRLRHSRRSGSHS